MSDRFADRNAAACVVRIGGLELVVVDAAVFEFFVDWRMRSG